MHRATSHDRMAYSTQQLPAGMPAAFLSLGQIISLVEKRLRWYGFNDWRITDVLCDCAQNVVVKIRGCNGVVMTISLPRDCGAPEYGIHAREAFLRPTQVPRFEAVRDAVPAATNGSARPLRITSKTHRSAHSQASN